MAKTVLHRSGTRGQAEHGWLHSRHTFSFANYYNPERIHFGALRVLNDDIIEPGTGFSTHPHDNMEIVSIPLEGALEHKDSMGNTSVIRTGEIQVMSAGTGIFHSEYNASKEKPGKFLQIWVFPDRKNVTPRYDQAVFDPADRHNRLQQVLSPGPTDKGLWIYQDAWFHLGSLDKGVETSYSLKSEGNGVYAFIIKGEATILEHQLKSRDGLEIWDASEFQILAETDLEILLMEVPVTP